MTEARFAQIVDAYGGDPARWPPEERDDAERWLASTAAAQSLVAQALGLDRALGGKGQTTVSSALERRLLDDFERSQQRWSLRARFAAAAEIVWPGAPAWQPACVLGLALAAGLCVAVFAPLDIAQPDEGASNLFALDGVPDAAQGI
jgi:hypothetical protein